LKCGGTDVNHDTFSFVPLLIVIALSVSVPVLLSRFKTIAIPVVVGEILGGVIFGVTLTGSGSSVEEAARILARRLS